MQVKIGNVIIPDAKVKRFIEIEGLPYSMINIAYTSKVDDGELTNSFMKRPQPILPFESETLKTKVLIHRFGKHENLTEITLMEPASEVSSGYKLTHFRDVNKNTNLVFVMPENVKDSVSPEELSNLEYIHLLLKRDIPKQMLKTTI